MSDKKQVLENGTRTTTTGSIEDSQRPAQTLPRVIPRNLPFRQSRNVVRVGHSHQNWKIFSLLRHDWFHVLLRYPTQYSLSALLVIWTLSVVFWGAVYYAVDRIEPETACGLGPANFPIGFSGGFAFSLQTTTTVGYTLPNGTNAFFDSCRYLQVVIYFQMIWSMMFNAFLFAFFYSRLAKSEARGVQLVFSEKALISIVERQVRFQMRLYDVDARHPVVESHVRLYAIQKDRPTPRQLRLLQPNDELNGMLFLSMPTIVSHHIDVYSMLHPRVPNLPIRQRSLLLRQADSVIGSRQEMICPICGENFNTHATWVKHVQYSKNVEEKNNYPVEGTHLSLKEKDILANPIAPITDLRVLKDYFAREISEVICVVEGIDPLTSGTFQALQSYRYQDLVWDAQGGFEPCLEASVDDVHIDLDHFHGIRMSRHRVVTMRQLDMTSQ